MSISHIPARHDAINIRLEEWAKWVRVNPQRWGMQPMFRMYQSKARQWEADPVIRIEINTLAASEIERAVSFLPDRHRTAIRWFYVWPWVPDNAVRREIGATRAELESLINDARDIICNRLKQKMLDKCENVI